MNRQLYVHLFEKSEGAFKYEKYRIHHKLEYLAVKSHLDVLTLSTTSLSHAVRFWN